MYKVSVIMPCHRAQDMPTAQAIFNAFDYEDKELIIVPSSIEVLMAIQLQPNVLVVGQALPYSVGEARNIGCCYSQSDIIIHQDSDDTYSPDWITKSVQHLIDSKADITGLSQAYFSHPPHLYEYTYQGGQPYVIGASMCYWRRVWEKQPFKHINSGEDALFQVNNLVIPHTYKEGFTANIHGGNTASHLQLNKKEFRLVK